MRPIGRSHAAAWPPRLRRVSSADPGAADGPPDPAPLARGRRRAIGSARCARRALKVHVIEPEGFNDAQESATACKLGQPVIVNLQGIERDLQRRLIDFSSGLCYALGGTM